MHWNKKGITLMELICTLAILTVVGALMGGLITSASRQYTRAAEVNRAKLAIDTMEQYLETELRYAKEASVSSGGEKALYSDGGIVCAADGSDFFSGQNGIYGGLYYTLTFSPTANNCIELHFSVARTAGTEPFYTDAETLHFLNAALDGSAGATYSTLYYTPAA